MSSAGASPLRSTPVRVAVAAMLAAVSGACVGTALSHDTPAGADGPRPARVGLASGVARLPLPAGWVPLHRHSSLPGLRDATAVLGAHSIVALDIRSPDDPSLLPADVRAAAGGTLPAPRLQRVGGRSTWRYELPEARLRAGVVAMTLPTTGGVVTVACDASASSITAANEDCTEAIGALRLVGATELPPAPEAAAQILLPGIVAGLNRRRRSGRRALRSTRSPRLRSEAALRLAAAYRRAAERLRPVAAGEARSLVGAFAELGGDHLDLAESIPRRDAVATHRAATAIERGEQGLQQLLAAQSSRANAASNATPDGAKSVRRTNARASRAPYSRSIPESSHSIESGPS